MITIKEVGELFVEELKTYEAILTENEDGRLESLNSEDDVTNHLRKTFGSHSGFTILSKGHNRAFGDMDIEINGRVYPINIKMVAPTTGTYNGGGPKVFNYVLQGKKSSSGWDRMVKELAENPPDKIDSDYYYLVYYKRSQKKPQFVSLTEIAWESIVANPANPIQLKQNLTTVRRSDKEKVSFMMMLMKEILYKKAKPYLRLEGMI
jgi:hypothetical protein|tara:strand:+ start:1371 stop:1991 length:621 start_codon:yes stop_codon:yes gene_type:complete